MKIKCSIWGLFILLLTACVNGTLPPAPPVPSVSPVPSAVPPTDRVIHSDVNSAHAVRISHISYQQAYPDIVMYAMSLVGMPYKYGGSSRASGFDCSGLVFNVYQATVQTNLPRTAKNMAEAGIPISKNQLKVGDLVFFNTTGQKYSHVGIYLGNGSFLHSPNSSSVVRIESLDSPFWSRQFSGARTYFIK